MKSILIKNDRSNITPRTLKKNNSKTAHDSLIQEIFRKDLEIINLNTLNSELLKSQEIKNDMIRMYYKEKIEMSKIIENLREENNKLKSQLAVFKDQIKFKSISNQTISFAALKSNKKNPLFEKVEDSYEFDEKKSPEMKNPLKEYYLNNPNKNTLLQDNLTTLSSEKHATIKQEEPSNKKIKFSNQRFSLRVPSRVISNNKAITVDHYKRLTLNFQPLNSNDSLSLQMFINGSKSLFKYNIDLVKNIIFSKQFTFVEGILQSYDVFKHTVDTVDECKLDEFYFIIKGIINDYKNTLNLFARINRLLEVQHIFCEKVLVDDIFIKICEIICSTLECDRSTLYLVDNVKRELWSRAATDSKTLFRLPYGKGLAGFVAEAKCPLQLDDAYSDPRFNKEYDKKTGYRTKSVLCVPIYDNQTGEVIGVIQSINKKIKPNVFDNNDLIVCEFLAKMIGLQLKQSIEISDYALNQNKIKRLMNDSFNFFDSEDINTLAKTCLVTIKNIYAVEKAEFYINLKDYKTLNDTYNSSFYKYSADDDTFLPVIDSLTKTGMIGHVLSHKYTYFAQSSVKNEIFNALVDIDTVFPTITLPIMSTKYETVGVIQFEYSVVRLGINDFRITKIESVDFHIIELLTQIFSMNLFKLIMRR